MYTTKFSVHCRKKEFEHILKERTKYLLKDQVLKISFSHLYRTGGKLGTMVDIQRHLR